jgi:hypothetical protein
MEIPGRRGQLAFAGSNDGHDNPRTHPKWLEENKDDTADALNRFEALFKKLASFL